MNIYIKNIDIITMDAQNPIIKNGNIAISGNSIAYVGEGMTPPGFVPDRLIIGRNKLAMPGLVNTHAHSAMTILRNFANDLVLQEWLFDKVFPAEAQIKENDVYWGVMLAVAEMIKSGTTSFADMYLFMDSTARAVKESGIRANLSKSPVLFDKDGDGGIIDDFADCRRFHNDWNNAADGRIITSVEVHSPYLFDKPNMIKAAELAADIGSRIQIHILETAAEREEAMKKYGMSPVKLCDECGIFNVPVIAAHCVHMSDEDIDIFVERKVSVSHNPTSNLKLASGIAPIPDMMKKGINITLGTDGAASNNNLDMFNEINLAALIHKGVNNDPTLVTAEEALKMATSNGAKAIGFDDTGSIKEGFKADIILLDTDKPHFCPMNDPLSAIVYSANGSDVDTVIVDGEILMESRQLKSVDEERIKYEVGKISKRILG